VNHIRHLIDSRAAHQIGPSGCWLLSVLSVSGRVEWWDDELAGVTGLGSRSTLGRVRQTCIDAGWLRYEPGARGRPAVYTILSKFDTETGQNVTQKAGRNRNRRRDNGLRRHSKTMQSRTSSTLLHSVTHGKTGFCTGRRGENRSAFERRNSS
jgi:hypothetical protein